VPSRERRRRENNDKWSAKLRLRRFDQSVPSPIARRRLEQRGELAIDDQRRVAQQRPLSGEFSAPDTRSNQFKPLKDREASLSGINGTHTPTSAMKS
jgi:hypothetical protein